MPTIRNSQQRPLVWLVCKEKVVKFKAKTIGLRAESDFIFYMNE